VDEIEPITYLLQGRLAPFFEPVEIGLAERLLITSIAAAYGIPKEEVSKVYKQAGDLGITAERLAPTATRESPSVVEVHRRLSLIAAARASRMSRQPPSTSESARARASRAIRTGRAARR